MVAKLSARQEEHSVTQDLEKAQAVLDFWFDDAGQKAWFKLDPAFDEKVRAEFEELAKQKADEIERDGGSSWEKRAFSALALIILLDQFPRNMYRDQPASFAWDHLALGAAEHAIDKGFDLQMPEPARSFFYMPYMHSESVADQKRCVELTETRLEESGTANHARKHCEVIERFGRFPHRNRLLGRLCTPEEEKFLADGGYAPGTKPKFK